MNLNMYFLEDIKYRAGCPMPVMLEVSSEKEIEISDKWDIRKVIFSQDGEEKSGGYSTPALSLWKYSYEVSRNHPKYFSLNLCDYLYGEELKVGKYEVSIRIIIYQQLENGKNKPCELEASKMLTIY